MRQLRWEIVECPLDRLLFIHMPYRVKSLMSQVIFNEAARGRNFICP